MSQTYASVLSAIKTHAVAAGAALTNPILDVAVGPPTPGTGRCVRIFYAGEAESARMGAGLTLNSRMIGERIAVICWIAVSNLGEQEIEAVETELYAFKHELRTRIQGDSQLGGASTDLEVGLFEPDYLAYGNARYRTVECEIVTDFTEYTIAP